MTTTIPDERVPLLNQTSDAMPQSKPLSKTHKSAVLLIGCLILVLAELGGSMFIAPFMQLLEEAICRKYYSNVVFGIDKRCKGDEVQKELVTLHSWSSTFMLIPGLVFAIPYGLIADSMGRRISLFLSLLGVLLMYISQLVVIYFSDSVDLRWIWAAGLTTIIGGGLAVLNSTVFAIINDVSSPELRSTVFFYVGTASMAAEMVASPLAYAAMKISPWFCISAGVIIASLSLPMILLLPETRKFTAKTATHLVPEEDAEPSKPTKGARLENSSRELAALLRYQFWDNSLLSMCLIVIVFTTLGKSMPSVLLQYVAKRFNWKWEEANLLNALRTGVAIIMTAIVMPAGDVYMRNKMGFSLIAKDLWLVRLSFVALLIGSIAIGLSPTPATLIASLVIYGIGTGNELAMRGLISQAAGDRVATVFTTMGVMETAGIVMSGPILTAVYKLGIQLKGGWLGLPFFFAASLFLVANCIFFSVPTRSFESVMSVKTRSDEDEAGGDV